MDADQQTDEEFWFYIQIFTASAIVTNIIFHICRYVFWDASFMQKLSDKKKLYILTW